MNNRVQVTIVTGFLGAGKTTFINQILKHNQHLQFALVENEFGDVAIDTQLIKGVDASQMFELKQGCICCTIVDEYELVLEELVERFENINHLIIETTGVANPIPIVQPFYTNSELQSKFELNGVYCMVDAVNFFNDVEQDIINKQIAVADEIIVSKLENQFAQSIETIKEKIELINPLAITHSFNNFDFKSFIIKKKEKFVAATNEHRHAAIQTKTLSFNQPLDKAHFEEWLSYTLTAYQLKIYRCKGLLTFKNELYKYILQGVGGSYELLEGEHLLDNEDSQIVFIGQLDEIDFHYLIVE